jgi:hypothetical protein
MISGCAGHVRFADGNLFDSSDPVLFGWRRQLTLAPFVPRLESTGVPGLILGVDGTEPTAAPDAAVESSGIIAGLIHGPKRPDKTIRDPGLLFDSLGARYYPCPSCPIRITKARVRLTAAPPSSVGDKTVRERTDPHPHCLTYFAAATTEGTDGSDYV